MVEIIYTKEFEKKYGILPERIQLKAEKQEKLFRQNMFHPSLSVEKLNPKNREIWSFRIDREYRILFRFLDKNNILFLSVGHHNWIYRF
jgi:toxin HigB-1